MAVTWQPTGDNLKGPAGPPNTLAIGTVTTGNTGDPAAATITGTAPDQTLNLTLPEGPAGPEGPPAGAHADTHAAGGTDPVTPLAIGAAYDTHDHTTADIVSGTFDISFLPTGTTGTTVPLGNDARFSDARTPLAHGTTHFEGGSDPITAASIGASATGHTHSASEITTGTFPLSRIPTGTTSSTVALGNHTHLMGVSPVTLTEAATIATDASLGTHFVVTLTADRTLGAPTNPLHGQRCIWEVQASGANRTLTLTTTIGGFVFGTDITEVTPVASGKTDFIFAIYSNLAGVWRIVAYVKGY